MNNDIENKIVYLRLDDILPNRFQPREVFDEEGLGELADSIKEHGVIQPIVVRQVGNKYELIAGERRSKASAIAGLTTIPAIIKNMDDKESAKVSLLENLQRKNLSAIEEARTYKRILELDNITQGDLAKTMGKSQPMVANKLRLLALPEEVQDALIKNQISERHARSLLNIKEKPTQLMLLERIKNERLTVRELDTEIKKILNQTDNNTNNDNNGGGMEAYNNFNNGFNNMGLDDYKSSLGNNMINNNFNNMNQFSNMPDNGFSNSSNNVSNSYNNDFSNIGYENSNISNNETSSNVFIKSNTNQSTTDTFSPLLENNNNTNNSFSLGSMFDGNPSYNNDNITNSDNSNPLISNIRENNMRPQTNQFLPNFDVPSNETNFSNSAFENNNTNNTGVFNNNFNNTYQADNDFSNNEFDNFTDFQSLNQPVMEQNYYGSNNQGELFNQPLNIVEAPKNIESDNSVSNDISSEFKQEDVADNPFDDAYENILFAKPLPVRQEDHNENNNTSSNQEIANPTSMDSKSNEYISLEHERTLFSARDAVYELKKTTDRIKQDGINLDSEEIDFDDYYQIIIKIKK